MNIIPVTASDFLASKNQEEWKQYNRIVTKMIDKFSEGDKNPIVYAQLVNTD